MQHLSRTSRCALAIAGVYFLLRVGDMLLDAMREGAGLGYPLLMMLICVTCLIGVYVWLRCVGDPQGRD